MLFPKKTKERACMHKSCSNLPLKTNTKAGPTIGVPRVCDVLSLRCTHMTPYALSMTRQTFTPLPAGQQRTLARWHISGAKMAKPRRLHGKDFKSILTLYNCSMGEDTFFSFRRVGSTRSGTRRQGAHPRVSGNLRHVRVCHAGTYRYARATVA